MFGFFKKNKKQKGEEVKIGDTVKCIDDRNWNSGNDNLWLQYGKSYVVLDIIYTDCCNTLCYDIGARNNESFTSCSGGKCKGSRIPGHGIHWAGAFRFAKSIAEEAKESKKESKSISKTAAKKLLDRALELEEYEEASRLQEIIND